MNKAILSKKIFTLQNVNFCYILQQRTQYFVVIFTFVEKTAVAIFLNFQ